MIRALAPLAATIALAAPAPAAAADQYRILVLARPNTYHYEYIPIARDSLERLARLHAFGMDYVSRTEAFEGDLSRYAMVMFLDTSGDELSPLQRARFEAYMRAGGNAMVVHRAAIMPPGNWPWFEKLVGRNVGPHPLLQTGVVTTIDARFPATFGLPPRWIWSDEFYTFTDPHRVRIDTVLSVDETSYDPTRMPPGQSNRGMGANHPIAWHHAYEKGRVFVTTLGHAGEMYRDPTYLAHLMGGIYWTATGHGEAR